MMMEIGVTPRRDLQCPLMNTKHDAVGLNGNVANDMSPSGRASTLKYYAKYPIDLKVVKFIPQASHRLTWDTLTGKRTSLAIP